MLFVRIAKIAVLAMLIAAFGASDRASANSYWEVQQGFYILNQGINTLNNAKRLLPQKTGGVFQQGGSFYSGNPRGCRVYPEGYGYPKQPGCPNNGYGHPGQPQGGWGTPAPQGGGWGAPQQGALDHGQIHFNNGIIPSKPAGAAWVARCDASRRFANIYHPVTRQHVGIMRRSC